MNETEKSCGNCANCIKETDTNWTCEEYGFYAYEEPISCHPPYDAPCEYWTDDPKKANTWRKRV